MKRIPEPELMLDADQARAYADADFEAPHAHCTALLLERVAPLPETGTAVDLGCGPGDIALRVARALPRWRVVGLDGSPAMLACGAEAVARAGLGDRVALREALLPVSGAAGAPFDLVFSNSLLHHLADPSVLWGSALALGRPGAPLFVMDLLRPSSPEAVRALVARYAGGEPPVLRRDFEASLHAAWSLAEVRRQLVDAGLASIELEAVSDRHWIAWGRLPG